jgi:hypothetical protein
VRTTGVEEWWAKAFKILFIKIFSGYMELLACFAKRVQGRPHVMRDSTTAFSLLFFSKTYDTL